MIGKKDIEILKELSKNAKQSTQKISKKTAIPIATVHNRIKKMEAEGIIRGYRVNIDYKKLGKGINSIILCQIDYKEMNAKGETLESFAEKMLKKNSTQRVITITGAYDLLLQIRLDDIEDMNKFTMDLIQNEPIIKRTETMMVLNYFRKKGMIEPHPAKIGMN